jgi:hypothetical protein
MYSATLLIIKLNQLNSHLPLGLPLSIQRLLNFNGILPIISKPASWLNYLYRSAKLSIIFTYEMKLGPSIYPLSIDFEPYLFLSVSIQSYCMDSRNSLCVQCNSLIHIDGNSLSVSLVYEIQSMKSFFDAVSWLENNAQDQILISYFS